MKVLYVADDGTEFTSKTDCEAHEADIAGRAKPGWLNADWQEVQVRKEDSVELWGFTGGDHLYATKILAERAAREAFPNEEVIRRYYRIFYRRYHWDGI